MKKYTRISESCLNKMVSIKSDNRFEKLKMKNLKVIIIKKLEKKNVKRDFTKDIVWCIYLLQVRYERC